MSRNPPIPAGDTNRNQSDRGRPEVIVEFLFERGVFHISVNNIGDRPALGVSIKFDQKILGLGGKKEVSALPLFLNIAFLGPGREIATLLDTSDSYFARKQPTNIPYLSFKTRTCSVCLAGNRASTNISASRS